MIFEKKISPSFAQRVAEVAARLAIPADWLMAVMWSESRLNPQARNPHGGATGLIQFMPATARHLGTTCEALSAMSGEEQLLYVERFFAPYAARCRSFSDLYLACFFPAALGRPDDYVFATRTLSAALIARQNPLFDGNKDDKITVGEFRAQLPKIFPRECHAVLF